jgi:hypothetical protein
MAVEKKQYTLKVVDEKAPAAEPVIRLAPQQTGQTDVALRIEVSADEKVANVRLAPPVSDGTEIRTHQPGIEALIEPLSPTFVPVEQDWGEASQKSQNIPWGWFALIGLILAAGVIWSLIGVQDAESQARELEVTTESILGSEEQEDIDAGDLIERIEATIASFYGAQKVDDLIPLVRQADRVEPLIKNYYGSKPLPATTISRIKQLHPLTLDNRTSFWLAGLVLKNGESRDLIVEIDLLGDPKIDWETSVCYQPMAWDQFSKDRPAGVSMDFRVFIENDSFYSHEFADSDRWSCFRLSALNGNEALFGYTPAGGALAQQLQGLIDQNRGQRVTIIVRLLVPEGLQSRQGVMIESLRAPRWIYLDPPEP